jgi:hypothetical protein
MGWRWFNRESPGVDVSRLPHWARVAFVSRCARHTLPLIKVAWPEVSESRIWAIRGTIEAVERSAARGQADAGLDRSHAESVKVSGAAQRLIHGFPSDEQPPVDPDRVSIVANVASSAAEAARAAMAPPATSANLAQSSYSSAADAARIASAVTLLVAIEDDFARLCRAARRGRWSDETPVPPRILGTI